MKTIALYMRLSNEDAHEGESCSIANQRALLIDYVKSHREFDGWNILEFSDDGYSGVSFRRPGIQNLLSLAGSTVNCIIVKDFSRFGRNLVEVGDYLDQVFPFLGVRFIAVNENYDSGKGLGSSVSLDVSLRALVYEMYSRDVSEKLRSANRIRMQQGKYMGRIGFYGYKKSASIKGGLEIDEAAAEVVRRIFRMAAEGVSTADIAVELNKEGIPSPLMYRRENHTDGGYGWKVAGDKLCWTRENVRRTLNDERYTGRLISHVRAKEDVSSKISKIVPKNEWIIAEDAHEAIVSRELYEQAQMALKHYRRTGKQAKPYQRFRGLIKCAYCGRALARNRTKKPYYYCTTKRTLPGTLCADVFLEESRLEECLQHAIQVQVKLAQDRAEAQRDGKTKESILREKLQECQKAVDKCKIRQASVFEDYAEGRIGRQEYLSWKKEITRQQEEAASEYEELSGQLAEMMQGKEREGTDLGRYAFVGELTREVLKEFVKAVKVSGKDTMEIVWNFKE